ncbi:MAG: hypothetical protein HY098_01995 [Nitrospinae bacterium]|nr:hypothetical protein [Nitrospinota bacterium]
MKSDKLILSVLEWLEVRGLKLFFAVLVLLVAGDVFVPKEEGAFPGHTWAGFYAFFGFAASLLITAVAKGLSKLFIHKEEDYYD